MERLQEQLNAPGNPIVCPAVFVVRDGKFLTGLRHYDAAAWRKCSVWTTPGGRSAEGETVEAALRRETAEETGITDLKLIDYLGTVPGGKSGDFVPIFVGETGGEPKLMEPEKFSEWRWCRPEDVPGEFVNPRALALFKSWLTQNPNR
jgi:ADP-ribose pyrophosphatase YjhB (NUDIX family)